jgi:hypothetical protein
VHGSVPFRDYFVTSPPLNQFKSGILLSLFGEKLIVSRTAGVIERSLIALLCTSGFCASAVLHRPPLLPSPRS